MRADMVAGATFPDYELSGHTGTHRRRSELQQGDPMIVVLSRDGYRPKDRASTTGWWSCIARSRSATPSW